MFTIKVYYKSGQKGYWEAPSVNVSENNKIIYLGGDKGENLELEGTESVYIENSNGKTIHIIQGN